EVPQELKDLTEIEEMLIAQVFIVVSVYNLRSSQYAYHENVINFPQDVQEFTTRLSRCPFLLDMLVIADDILQSLPENGLLIDQLPQIFNNQFGYENHEQININESEELLENNKNDENDDSISQTFVSVLPPRNNENNPICNTLNHHKITIY
ncbi:41443_t:CDS:2, partial [Gigaspora margarita]